MPAKSILVALAAVLLVGAALRFTALDYGLPRTDLGQDERITLLRARHGTDTRRLATPRYNWPQFNIYASRAAIRVGRGLERLAGAERHPGLWLGRAYTAALGTLTLALVYWIGRRLFDLAVGVASAGFLAVIPLHANRSRLWVPDVPMTAAYCLALLAAAWALERPSWRRFALGGLAVGLAAAFKYNGAGACLALIVAAILAARQAGGGRAWATALGRLAVAALASVAAFVACDPPVLGRLQELRYGVSWIGDIYTAEPSTGPLGWHTVSYVLRSFFVGGHEGVGPWICLLALAGVVLLARRRDHAAAMTILPGLLYLFAYGLVLRNPFERMFLPLLPHLALAAGFAAVSVARALASRLAGPRLRRATVVALVAAAWLAAAPQAVLHARAARHGDTRLDALAWIRDNVPAGSSILWEWNMVRPDRARYSTNSDSLHLYGVGRRPARLAVRWDYVVATSETYDWVFRQRSRPGFAERAAVYDTLFTHPRFREVARFDPGRDRYGPVVRIFESRRRRGRGLARAPRQDDVVGIREAVEERQVEPGQQHQSGDQQGEQRQ